MIKRMPSGCRATTLELYAQSGLRSTPEGLLDLTPLPDITARLDANTITVRLDDTGQTWNSECSGPARQAVTELGGITLAVTTAFILHFGNDHASPGELLATTDRALLPEAAQQWAQETIRTTMNIPSDQLIGWQQVGGHPQAVHTLDAISIKRFVLRRHTDAWKLIEVAAEIGGRHGLDPGSIRNWATHAARTKADTRIISWVSAPTTDDGFTTLHGAGAPR